MTAQDLVTAGDLVTVEENAGQDRARACHQMLLRLAGRLPDGLLTRSRDWLAHGEFGDLARSVTFSVVSHDVVLADADALLLADLLAETDADPSGLTQLTLDDFDPFPYYAFAAQIPPELAGAGVPPDSGSPARAAVEQAAVAAVAAQPGAIGLWRAWRFPPDGVPWPPAKRVFVVEVAGPGEPGIAASLQEQLAAAGEAEPQVEVYQSGSELPLYQEFGRSYGELLWAAADDPGVQLATVFDEIDADTGPRFRSDHPYLEASEADKVVPYLYAGEPLLVTDGLMDDVVDGSQTDCVPMSFRTDGRWIWTDAAAYYAEQYRLAPDAALLAHLRSRDYTLPQVDGVAVYRAFQALRESANEEVVWIFGADADEPASGPEPGTEPEQEPAIGRAAALGQDPSEEWPGSLRGGQGGWSQPGPADGG